MIGGSLSDLSIRQPLVLAGAVSDVVFPLFLRSQF